MNAPEPMSLQELTDIFQIQQIVLRYAFVQDANRHDLFDQVFTPDAMFYNKDGEHDVDVFKARTIISQSRHTVTQHFKTSPLIDLDGDSAVARFYVFGAHAMNHLDPPMFFIGSHVEDHLTRVDGKWRISARHATRIWISGNKEVLNYAREDGVLAKEDDGGHPYTLYNSLDQPLGGHRRVPESFEASLRN